MNIDIRTLVIIAGITSILQVIALFFQYRLNKAHLGIGWWPLGFASMVMGYVFLSFRDLVSSKLITIIAANALVLLGAIFIYIGIMRFLNKKENRKIVISIFALFILSFFYYTYVDDNITLRTVIIYAVAGFFSLLTAQSLFLYKPRLINTSAYFNAVLFLINGCFFVFRAVEALTIDPVHGLFTPTMMQTVSFLVLFVYGILMTFGLIIMVNQRLNAEIKESEEELRGNEERFRKLADATWEGIIIHKDGIILDANESAVKMLGHTAEEVIGKNIIDFIAPESTAPALQKLREGATHDQLYLELKIVRKDKTILSAEALGNPIRYKNIDARVTAIRDITFRKQAEEALRASEAQNRQLQKTESLSRMAAAVAHHFNNKLGAVIGNLELALMELPKGEKAQARVTAAMEASCTAAEMSRLMLTYLGQSTDKRELLDLSETCRSGLPMLQAVMPVSVVLETDLPSPGPVISTTNDYMQQILTNLVTNACEAIGDGRGTITMRVETVSPAQVPTGHRYPMEWQPQSDAYARLEVADTGSGIEDKDIEALFDPFFSTKFTGRGMGLAVVLGIVKTHNGVLTVESAPKQGSTFRVFFPLSEEAPQQT